MLGNPTVPLFSGVSYDRLRTRDMGEERAKKKARPSPAAEVPVPAEKEGSVRSTRETTASPFGVQRGSRVTRRAAWDRSLSVHKGESSRNAREPQRVRRPEGDAQGARGLSHCFLLSGEQAQTQRPIGQAAGSPCPSLPPITQRPPCSLPPRTDLTVACWPFCVFGNWLFSSFLRASRTARDQTVQGQAGEQLEPRPLQAGV